MCKYNVLTTISGVKIRYQVESTSTLPHQNNLKEPFDNHSDSKSFLFSKIQGPSLCYAPMIDDTGLGTELGHKWV